MNENDLISVIIPVYNAEKYLRQCLDSVVNQTYQKLEIICINDGSTDDSSSILNTYSVNDARIKVINKENSGVSQTRNMGIVIAQGDYILFIDADDWIDPETCEQAMSAMQLYQPDVVLWGYISERKDGQYIKKLFNCDRVFDESECKASLHRRFIGCIGEELANPELADSLCPVWGKLYKRSLICSSNAFFTDLREIGAGEDCLFNLEVFGNVNKAVYLDKYYYHYRKDNINAATSKYNPNLFAGWENLYNIMENYIKQKNLSVDYLDGLNNRVAIGILSLGLNIVLADVSSVQKIKMLKNILSQTRYRNAYRTLDFRYFPFHWKLFYICAKYRLTIGLYVFLCIINRIIRGKNE